MHRFYLSLGSNLEPEKHLRAALRELRARFGELQVSSVYETAAVGFEGPPFWNLAAGLQTDLDVEALNGWLHALEAREGRVRGGPRYADRTLDIDIVAVGGQTLERPELREAFVLAPLSEIAPQLIEPQSGKTIGALWAYIGKTKRDESPGRLDVNLLAD
ncbi:MAG TPA: 2-amino-4-hydroxy-6-hydroxymethyldihydropteridine diphosphokinase [Rhodanobacteraceae bacterium]|nr:2-amino-4-hydroxy-6-hydroxymethyldihydropteridine diphosphokinase [Rhodanobacteraceae bacterium]